MQKASTKIKRKLRNRKRLKSLKPIEPYKAKGIKERGQFVLRKEGKKK